MVDFSGLTGRRGLALLLVVTRKIKELCYIILAISLQKSVASGTWFLNLNLSSACLIPCKCYKYLLYWALYLQRNNICMLQRFVDYSINCYM